MAICNFTARAITPFIIIGVLALAALIAGGIATGRYINHRKKLNKKLQGRKGRKRRPTTGSAQ